MNKIIDLHTHLNTLASVYQLRSKIQKHLIDLNSHIGKSEKLILSVAIYVPFYRGYDEIINLTKLVISQIEELPKVSLIKNIEDLESNYKVGVILHLESARAITHPEKQITNLYELGIRGIIPVHFIDNKIGNSCDDPLRRLKLTRKDHGLTQFGEEFIDICNELNLWLDLAHTTDKTGDMIYDKAKFVMISHIGIRDIKNWQRNKPLSFFKKIADKKGVIGITPWTHLIGSSPNSFIKQFELGIKNDLNKNLCIGSDFGAPINTCPEHNSVFKLAKELEVFPAQYEDLTWNNAFQFFERVLKA